MSGQTLMQQRDEIKRKLESSMEKMYKNGVDAAEKTRTYRMKLQQQIMILKAEGMQVSIIDKVAKGEVEVAQAEFDMNVAEVLYRSSQENIMIQKKLLDSIEEDIRREYGRNT